VEYYLLHKARPISKIVTAKELRAVTEVLGNAYEKLKHLALQASIRKTQLILFNLSSDIYKFYLDTVLQVQVLEKKLFNPFKIENYPDEYYVVDFNKVSKQDNTQEIFNECQEMKLEIQKVYTALISDSSIGTDQKKHLQQQLSGILNCFTKLKAKTVF
jgi:hypothetical protein